MHNKLVDGEKKKKKSEIILADKSPNIFWNRFSSVHVPFDQKLNQ